MSLVVIATPLKKEGGGGRDLTSLIRKDRVGRGHSCALLLTTTTRKAKEKGKKNEEEPV